MADLSKLRFNGTDYNVKDASAPTRKFNNAYSKTGNLPISSDDTTQTAIGKLENNIIPKSAKGTANGVAELDANGKVPSSQLPSYVDDVLEYSAKSSFPATGESGKIYVDTTTNKTYRWSGSAYVEISESLALGETDSTAYRGDRGKAAYDHSQLTSGNPHNVTKSDVGLGNVGNFKAVSTAASQGLSNTEKANARSNIGAGTGNGTYSKPTGGIPKSDLASAVQTTLDQVAKNQTNILYTAETGVKNRIILNDTFSIAPPETTGLTVTNNGDGTITVSGTPTSTNADNFVYITIGNFYYSADKYRMENQRIGTNGYYFTNDNHLNSNVESGMEHTYTSAGSTPVIIRLTKNTTYPSQVVYPMIRPAFITDTTFQPGAKPNYDLTYLQAEDRAALAEVVDSGAKNKINIIAGASTTIGNITFTVNSDRSVTVNGTANNSDTFFYLNAANGTSSPVTFTVGSLCILNGCPSGGAQNTYELQFSSQLGDFRDRGSGVEVPANATGSVVIAIRSGYAPSNLKFYPMLATKAAFGVSDKFVPYKGNFITVPVCKNVRYNCTSTDYERVTALDFTVPSNTYARVTASLKFSNGAPRGIKIIDTAITNPANAILAINEVSENYGGITTSCLLFNAGTVKTYAVYTKSASVSGNDVVITIEYLS